MVRNVKHFLQKLTFKKNQRSNIHHIKENNATSTKSTLIVKQNKNKELIKFFNMIFLQAY